MPCEELETGRGGNIYTVETGSLQMSGLCVCVCVCVCLVVLENQRLSIANVPLAVWISHIFLEMCPFHLTFHYISTFFFSFKFIN